MAIHFIDNLDGVEKRLAETMEALPISKYDCKKFVFQDVFYKGNYISVPSDAKASHRKRVWIQRWLKGFHADKSHFNNFEVEIDGMRLRDRYVFEGQEQSVTVEGFELHVVKLGYPDKNVRIRVCTQLDGSSFLLRWLEIENCGDKPFVVTGIYPMAGILYAEELSNNFRAEHLRPRSWVGTFNDNYYLGEGEFAWTELPKATLTFGHEHPMFNPPVYFLKNDVACMITLIHIETSMMTHAEFTRCGEFFFSRNINNQDYVHFKVGADKRGTYRTIRPGESVVSPKVHFGQIYGDTDDAVNEFNEHLRTSVIPKRNQPILYPIEYSGPGSDCCQIDKAYLMQEVDKAAEIGAEVFMMDAGWFGPASGDWYKQRGDWWETEYLENGLADVFRYAKSKGLMNGLWVEIEGADLSSKLAKDHPDWLIEAYGRKIPTLNIIKPEVRDFVYNTLCDIIERYDLDVFRIDGGLKEPSEEYREGTLEGTSWEYYEYLFDIFKKVRARFPNLYFENCSGGGGRCDWAIMRHFDWTAVTDSFAPAAQLRVAYGMSMAFAPELLLSCTNTSRMYNDVDFITRSCLLGRIELGRCYEEGIEIANENLIDSWNRSLKIYKEDIRPIIGRSKIYHHTPFEPYMEKGTWLVWELATPEKDKAVFGVFRYSGEQTGEYLLKPRGLSPAKVYDVYFDNTREHVRMNGLDLIRNGYPIRISGNLMSEMVIVSEVKG